MYCEDICHVWIEGLILNCLPLSDTSDSSQLKIEVYVKHQFRADTFEGEIQESVRSLLDDQGFLIPQIFLHYTDP